MIARPRTSCGTHCWAWNYDSGYYNHGEGEKKSLFNLLKDEERYVFSTIVIDNLQRLQCDACHLGTLVTHLYLNIKLHHTVRQINRWLRENKDIIEIYSGITSGRVLNWELLYTEILQVNLFAFAYSLFHEHFSPIYEGLVNWREIFMKQSVGKCK